MKPTFFRSGAVALSLGLGVLLAAPVAASAATTFANASRPDDSADCLSALTACKTIGAAVTKAGPGGTVNVAGGTYNEHVTLAGGESLRGAGSPAIAPTTAGAALTVSGTTAGTVSGLIMHSNNGSSVVLNAPATLTADIFDANFNNAVDVSINDGAGAARVLNNAFLDPTPVNGDAQVGMVTTSTGNVTISGNTFTGFVQSIEVLSPAAGVPGTPQISGNTITGTHAIGAGVEILSSSSITVTGPTAAHLVGNTINSPAPSAGNQATGVFVLDSGSFVPNAAAPTAGVTMERNRILGGENGIEDHGARGPVTLDGDVIAKVGSITMGGSGINSSSVNGLGGDVTIRNVDIVGSINLAMSLDGGNHATIDSSIIEGGTFESGTAPTCTITFSAGPLTVGGDSCHTFQTNATASFVNRVTNDYHLTAAANTAFIDHGNPLAPPAGATDPDGDPRSIDADGACPLNPVRDIGADEFNPGIPACTPMAQQQPPVAGAGPTGQRAAALKKCKRKHGAKRKKCRKRAKKLPL